MSETKLRPVVYLVAAFAFAMTQIRAEVVASLKQLDDLRKFFQEFYDVTLTEQQAAAALDLMERVQLIRIDDDEYVGRYYTLQKTTLERRFRELAAEMDDSPLAIILRGKMPWVSNVLRSDRFWSDVNDDISSGDEGAISDAEIPASDRIVTLLHNSPERREIAEGLAHLHSELTTSNSLAEEIGEDRDRIVAEVEASQAGLRSERIKLGFIKDVVLRVLKEIGGKLKDKAIELGVDRLVDLIEALIGHA